MAKTSCDIEEKLMSSIVFVNLHNESENLGTDFYDAKLKKLKQFLINIIMDISLQVDQTLGTEWKKRNQKREKMYPNKLCYFRD